MTFLTMKKKIVIGLCLSMLFGCNSHEKNQSNEADNTAVNKKNINHRLNSTQVGGRFLVLNDLAEQDIEILVYETNHLKDGVYYFHVYIKNNGAEPFKLNIDRVLLVDESGHKFHVGLSDYQLLETIQPHMVVSGIIGFDCESSVSPIYLKFK